jgi:hypothetical protein
VVPYPVAFRKSYEKWQQKPKVKLDDVKNLAVPIFYRQAILRVIMKNSFEFAGINPPTMVPNGVVFGVDLEYFGCPLQKIWCEISVPYLRPKLFNMCYNCSDM